MADQARWFKLWCSAPADDSIQNLPPALRWAWVAFGAYTKQHGTGGIITVSPTNASLAAQLGVPPSALLEVLSSLPSIYLGTAPVRWPHGHEKHPVCEGEFIRGSYPPSVRGTSTLEKWCTDHGKITVTWKNWNKYQVDTTQAARGAASRSKKRREENRRDKKRKDLTTLSSDGALDDAGVPHGTTPLTQRAREVLAFLNHKAQRHFPDNTVNLDFIRARLREGATVNQCRAVIGRKTAAWRGDEKMALFLRPATLFNRTKFSQYLGELPATAFAESSNGMP